MSGENICWAVNIWHVDLLVSWVGIIGWRWFCVFILFVRITQFIMQHDLFFNWIWFYHRKIAMSCSEFLNFLQISTMAWENQKKESTVSMKQFPALHPIIEPVLQGITLSLQHSEPVFLNSACDYRGAQLEKCRVFLAGMYRQLLGCHDRMNMTNVCYLSPDRWTMKCDPL